ncbi:LysR family transcriptional regulator [Celeribacter neptunius]|uniref:DNA-binding transcriptional regulator, LysR family n=1 Tax=Celeribacter neptunius TaxID=588602 RepID=A0A1I3KZS4_9RHOB|nr:LysR family transcriptional regulator [Celeribacter neptunius]SFI77615.1 DNA-binding transcriptional regulator, LysR family [Celeribacter neptunius]
MKDPSGREMPKLDDYYLFLAVADAGGLAGASLATGTPQPTLSRRMATLERLLGKRLFERGGRGYSLTSEGRALLQEAEALREAATRLCRFQIRESAPEVRITAGRWTTRYVARHLSEIWSRESPWRPALLASNSNVDIARREADIGIRNRRPEQSWLAGRKLGTLHYAEYATGPEVTGYVTLHHDQPTTPSERWLRTEHADEIVATASDARSAADMAVAGVGRALLPCFAGREIGGLMQVSPLIEALTHDEWLVSHHDARFDPPVRAALDALAELLMSPERFGEE